MKRINGEDVSKISPTLGFNIKTMAYKEYVVATPVSSRSSAPLSPPAAAEPGAEAAYCGGTF